MGEGHDCKVGRSEEMGRVRSQESGLLNRAMPCIDTEDPCSGGQTESGRMRLGLPLHSSEPSPRLNFV